MRYLLCMTISGSVMFLLYLLMKLIMGKRLPNRWRYFCVKGSMLYYLIPLPFLKPIYEGWLRCYFPKSTEMVYSWRNSGAVIKVNNQWLFSPVLQGKMVVFGVWLFVALVIFSLLGIRYLRKKQILLQYQQQWNEITREEAFRDLKENCGVYKALSCYTCDMEQGAFTLGIFKPLILCRKTGSEPLSELIICHELVHIKHGDIWWKMIMSFVKIIHWYNPMVWLLARELELVSEMFCDDTVLQEKTEEECQLYAKLLCEEAIAVKQDGIWQVALSNNVKCIKTRIKNVMKQHGKSKHWENVLVGFLAICLVVGNSLTALCYENIYYQKLEGTSDEVEEKAEQLLKVDVMFVPKGLERENNQYITVVVHDYQFVNEKGIIYPVGEKTGVMENCEHMFIDDMVQTHMMLENGCCNSEYYEAERCRKCGYVVQGDYLTTAEFEKCIHLGGIIC